MGRGMGRSRSPFSVEAERLRERSRPSILALLTSLILLSCAPVDPSAGLLPQSSQGSSSPAGRALVMASLDSSVAFAVNALRVGNRETGGVERDILNALLVIADEHGRPYPLLAESLPELNTESWRIFPD